jgi:hypothetical protein
MEEGEVGPGRGSSFAQHTSTTTDSCEAGRITINTLPDEVLLGIFDFCVNLNEVLEDEGEREWETLVHVCRRWRYVVFGSPHRLNLRLVCTAGTRVEETLDIWPAFPIDLRVYDLQDSNEDNSIATLELNDRICEIYVQSFAKGSFERFAASMQVPFPSLTDLSLSTFYLPLSAVPDSFLGGSAPGLRSLCLNGVTILGLPNLLLSATSLIRLRLENMSHSGHISPHVMADCLSSLGRLEELRIVFPLQYFPYQMDLRPPPLTRTILRKLTSLSFQGMGEYLEVLFTWIDAPLHEYIYIKLFNPVIFDISRISLFNGRERLIQTFNQAHMRFNCGLLEVTLSSLEEATGDRAMTALKLSVKCGDLAWQLQSLHQSRSRYLPPLDLTGTHGRFDVTEFAGGCSPPWARDMEKARWMEFLHLFAAVENLYLSEGLVLCITPTLREPAAREGGSVKVLPALKSLFIEKLRPPMSGPLMEMIGEFTVAREFACHPVDFQYWKEERK